MHFEVFFFPSQRCKSYGLIQRFQRFQRLEHSLACSRVQPVAASAPIFHFCLTTTSKFVHPIRVKPLASSTLHANPSVSHSSASNKGRTPENSLMSIKLHSWTLEVEDLTTPCCTRTLVSKKTFSSSRKISFKHLTILQPHHPTSPRLIHTNLSDSTLPFWFSRSFIYHHPSSIDALILISSSIPRWSHSFI